MPGSAPAQERQIQSPHADAAHFQSWLWSPRTVTKPVTNFRCCGIVERGMEKEMGSRVRILVLLTNQLSDLETVSLPFLGFKSLLHNRRWLDQNVPRSFPLSCFCTLFLPWYSLPVCLAFLLILQLKHHHPQEAFLHPLPAG